MPDYRSVADAVAEDILAGRLRPGDRLPPQRRFAREHGIANSTAVRVYSELIRRGLVVGEVGRGTYVKAGTPDVAPALSEPGGAGVDLELNFSILPEQPSLMAEGIGRGLRPDALASSLVPVGAAGTAPARDAAISLLARAGWAPGASQVLFAGNGRQAIAAVAAALVPVGERLAVEALTYPVVKGIAARLGISLVPIAVDEYGMVPDALESAHHARPLRAVYLQPTLHNPLGSTMPSRRRSELVDTLHRLDIPVIEDSIYGFLREDLPPLAGLAPERVVVVDSLSKRLAPGLTVGFVVTESAELRERIAAALRSGGWMAQRFALAAATRWVDDGTAATVQELKRRDAAARQQSAAQRLDGFDIAADPHAYHCWWKLPGQWRAETFVAAAARRGIAITPAAAFTVGAGHAPNAVRLALASPPPEALSHALDVLAMLARGTPEDTGVE
ncbi:PLP-dependent aminotransferase family protein [Phytoactinopolyspora mesophila]|uniref:Aminotransferase class I/II-fold pyridoxal phosphate-dependent enzyme n=1 Tax=Phytoactinopolyspora mesophila TaxID=2650750 RepID=A0A7K3M5S9_9ACTN|nr:PLP-dependent aminotransferase family protein [Phytoactinopolyspora mesophila]NDL58272.1 aminotransferase class I/II-fold pyridoxal phosphate-dependent enzyme [Phytoactinopolyspora mesophila]